MSKYSGKRPSAGLIVATIALVMAIGGSALAVPGALEKITKGKVKTIAANQIKDLASGLDVKSADTADTATTANTAKIATNILSANVLGNGTMLGSIPAGATSARTALGNYTVQLGRDITGCTISAAAANNGAPQVALVAVGVDNATTLRVFTRTGANVVSDEPFYVQAICPG